MARKSKAELIEAGGGAGNSQRLRETEQRNVTTLPAAARLIASFRY
ncbi:hypothetical protein COLO4_35971 [Corchorus olitorius]|uniref:Uncharacterized protein n=1 Tax=Corchorus olitorius TaxID=93759 RepID=A0A1R3GBM7_9ROSI|nr:hypothetical protein COLO4_35971 [Corchorus olitorius]